MASFNKFSGVRVVGGKFKDLLRGQRGEVDTTLETGEVVVTFRQGRGDDAKQDSFLLAEGSLSPAKVVEKPIAEQRAEVERSIGLHPSFDYI